MSGDALAFRRVDFAYGRTPILVGLDLTIANGTIVGVLGPNGAGKTTFVRLASATLQATSGSISLFGDDLSGLTSRERARRVAVVPQETYPVFDFTVDEIVRMGRAPHLGLLGIEGPADRAIAREAMERCEVAHVAARSLRELSGGERQRVLLARALTQRPRLLLLDEPTAFLDLKHRLDVYRVLSQLHRESGLTIVVVSHDINLAARHCDRLVLLRCGSVAADGTPAEVLRPDPIRAVYEVEVEIGTDPASGRPYVIPLARSAGAP
ncbi:MAG TPA: ABC transporter ATP-binding protein [Candidatus Sulfotelmatobacter sp.]|jgi:iron complex transport system ATP-binding protein|nr:ABC transporter ATP-binding protein [Candidatus Sulfotelmatobacter sp.]